MVEVCFRRQNRLILIILIIVRMLDFISLKGARLNPLEDFGPLPWVAPKKGGLAALFRTTPFMIIISPLFDKFFLIGFTLKCDDQDRQVIKKMDFMLV